MLVAILFLVSMSTEAALTRDLGYPESTVWRCAVRFLRVDSGYRIIERDREAGFLLFEYVDDGRTYNASMEIMEVRDGDGGRFRSRVQLNVHGQPRYVESLLFNRLERKLKTEYGMPVEPGGTDAFSRNGVRDDSARSKTTDDVDEDVTEEDLEMTERRLKNSGKDD